jgi:HTH-type transcriptional regulator, sugar sensing transcriptional regulator
MTNNPTDLLYKSLIELGLTEFDASLYQELLNSPQHNIAKIAQKLGTYRLKIYDSLKTLQIIGLVKEQSDSSNQIELESPSKILNILQRKKFDIEQLSVNLESVLPNLQSQYYSQNRSPVVKVYEGKAQFINIFHQILEETESGQKICMYGENNDFYDIIPFDYFRETWTKKRIAKKVSVDVIWKQPVPKEAYAIMAFGKEELRESRILPVKYSSNGAFWVTPHKIVNWNTVFPKAIVNEDITTVRMYQDMFDLMWESLPQPDEKIIKNLQELSSKLTLLQ